MTSCQKQKKAIEKTKVLAYSIITMHNFNTQASL